MAYLQKKCHVDLISSFWQIFCGGVSRAFLKNQMWMLQQFLKHIVQENNVQIALDHENENKLEICYHFSSC